MGSLYSEEKASPHTSISLAHTSMEASLRQYLQEIVTSRIFVFSLLATLATYVCLSVLRRLYLSPISSIPGPWYAVISDFWFTWIFVRFRRVRTIDSLFKTYGPVVRVSPNRVVFLDASTYKQVYGTSAKVDKHPMYKTFTMCVTNFLSLVNGRIMSQLILMFP